jgi:hypothetical protein
LALTDRPQKVGPPPGSNGQSPLAPAPRPYNWRATAGLILGIVVVAGAMGVFMRVIPTPFTQPTPTSAPTARPIAQPAGAPAPATFAPTTAPLAAPTLAPTDSARNQPATVAPAAQPTSAPITAPTAAPQPTPVHTVVPTTQPTTAPTAAPASAPTLATGAVPTGGVTTPIMTTDTSVTPALQDEISQAYAHYWDVTAEAFWSLDDSQLSSVTADNELAGALKTMDELRAEGRAGATLVTHNAVIVKATQGEAQIFDNIADRSFYVDPVTKQPLNVPSDPKPLTGFYFLHKIDGSWKVVDEG